MISAGTPAPCARRFLKFGQVLGTGQLAVQNQIGGFFKRRVRRQILDRVAPVVQSFVDIADAGFAGDDAFQAWTVDGFTHEFAS